jgi:acyl-CoA hydrolase
MEKVITTNLVMPQDLNPHGTLFGGKILAEMDKTAALCSQFYSNLNTVTVHISEVNFKKPIRLHDAYVVEAEVIKAGNTSITVSVKVYVRRPSDWMMPDLATEATFVFVTIDEEGHKKFHGLKYNKED